MRDRHSKLIRDLLAALIQCHATLLLQRRVAEQEAHELLLDLDGVVWTAIVQPLVDEGETPLLKGSDCIEAG